MKSVVVVGGGIIGLSCAYYLRQGGCDVIVLDPDGGRVGASYGNAGFIGASHYIPLANPKSMRNALRWMLSPTSPFYIQPRLDDGLIRWGLLFLRHANSAHADRMAKPLSQIGLLSQRLFEEWQATFPKFSYEKDGLIDLYQTEEGLAGAVQEAKRARALGIDAVELSKADIAALEPNVEIQAVGGIHMRSDARTWPPGLMAALLEKLTSMGVPIFEERVTGFHQSGGRITSAVCGANNYDADSFVLAGGIWSRALVKSLGIDIPMQAGRGYSLTYPLTQLPLRHSLYLNEVSVALTPMEEDKVRVGGTMEIVPIGTPPRLGRVRGILASARKFLPKAQFPDPTLEDAWFGYRPCSADGIPYIGRHRKFDNLILATGHSMLGLGLGPATGKLVSEIALNHPPCMDVTPFSPNRFS